MIGEPIRNSMFLGRNFLNPEQGTSNTEYRMSLEANGCQILGAQIITKGSHVYSAMNPDPCAIRYSIFLARYSVFMITFDVSWSIFFEDPYLVKLRL